MNCISSFFHLRASGFFQRQARLLAVLLGTAALSAQTATTDWSSRPVAEVRGAAEAGNTAAMRSLANAYLTGTGLPQNALEAARWLARAAEKNDVLAQFVLGILYDEGKGVPRDMGKAVQWYRLAAEGGLPDAQFNLGVCYAKGDGVKRDQLEAIRWFTLAAEQHDAQAQSRLGLAYLTGNGVEQNAISASKWLRAAAYQDDVTAEFFLGRLYQDGTGVLKDPVEAAKWFRKSAEQGYMDAQYKLGVAYVTGEGVVSDPREASSWFQKAAAQGHVGAQRELGSDPVRPATAAITLPTPRPNVAFPSYPTPTPSASKSDLPPFFSSPAGRDLPPAATPREELNPPSKIESPSFFSGPRDGGGKDITPPAPTPPAPAFPSVNPTKDEAATTIAPTASGPDMTFRPRETGTDTRRPTGEELLRQPAPQPSNDLVSPTTLAVMTLGTAVVMMVILGYMVLFFKSRIASLESEIKKTQFELSKANVNLTAMLHQVEALQLSEGSGARPERKQVSAGWKEVPTDTKGAPGFRAKRSAA